jgi:DNA repair protein RadC
MKKEKLKLVSEIEISYKTKVKPSERVKIETSKDAFKVLIDCYSEDEIEHTESVVVLLLNRANKVLGWRKISQGGITGTVMDKRIIYQLALLSNATQIIISHNHPSGNLKPSESDISITKEINDAGKLMDITLLDHLIITTEGYYSFGDEGRLDG